MAQVFISFVREDAKIAAVLADALEHAGIMAWLYTRQPEYGTEYDQVICEEIAKSKLLLVILSVNTKRKPKQVEREIRIAALEGKALIPILADLTHKQFQKWFRTWQYWFETGRSAEVRGGDVAAIFPGLLRQGRRIKTWP